MHPVDSLFRLDVKHNTQTNFQVFLSFFYLKIILTDETFRHLRPQNMSLFIFHLIVRKYHSWDTVVSIKGKKQIDKQANKIIFSPTLLCINLKFKSNYRLGYTFLKITKTHHLNSSKILGRIFKTGSVVIRNFVLAQLQFFCF